MIFQTENARECRVFPSLRAEGGHDYAVEDLYEIGFDPCFRIEDYNQYTGGPLPADVVAQQEKVTWAGALVFIAPVSMNTASNIPASKTSACLFLRGFFRG